MFWLDRLPFGGSAHRDGAAGPTIRPGGGLLARLPVVRIDDGLYRHALAVRVPSAVGIDLNRSCTSFDALAGPDAVTVGPGALVFTVLGDDGTVLWRSGAVRQGDGPVRVHASLAGQRSVRLEVERLADRWSLIDVADWADARLTC